MTFKNNMSPFWRLELNSSFRLSRKFDCASSNKGQFHRHKRPKKSRPPFCFYFLLNNMNGCFVPRRLFSLQADGIPAGAKWRAGPICVIRWPLYGNFCFLRAEFDCKTMYVASTRTEYALDEWPECNIQTWKLLISSIKFNTQILKIIMMHNEVHHNNNIILQEYILPVSRTISTQKFTHCTFFSLKLVIVKLN